MSLKTQERPAHPKPMESLSPYKPIPATEASPRPRRTWPRPLATDIVLPLVIFWAGAVGLQLAAGAFQSEFGGHPDEASHFVTGLMVHDYLLGGDWLRPMAYAEEYYRHYPRVSIGHWPPLFYVIQAAWTIPLGTSRTSMLLLMAVLTSLTALALFRSVRAEFGVPAAWLAGLLLVALPLVQMYDAMLMADLLTGLFFFWATLCFGKFLDSGNWRDAAAFGLVASLALLTKGSGVILALVPPLGVLFSRRFAPLRRLAFWLPALLVLVLCGPWYWFTRHMASTGFSYSAPTLDFTIPALGFYSLKLAQIVGFGLLLVVALGCWDRLIRPTFREGARGKWAACAALLLGVWIFNWAVPIGFEERYLIPAVPCLLLFLIAGMDGIRERLPTRWGRARAMVVATLVLGAFAFETFDIPLNFCGGFQAVARQVLALPKETNVLVSSDPLGEGMFIAEVAGNEPRPGHVILRSSKVLGQSDWMGLEYVSFFNTPAEVLHELDRLAVDVVMLDTSAPPLQYMAHHELLAQALAAHPERWRAAATHDVVRHAVAYPGSLHVYHRIRG